MPLTRYQIRNEYGLADMELYEAADKDDPEALLEGVAMAGLVGVLRQLGDLADFAAEIFHCLHEELLVTAARGQGLVVRVHQLEAGVPLIEKAVLSRADVSSFFSHPGSDWHPSLQTENNLITSEELPRCMMDSYEECHGPPRLFLLDKFDVAGDGACLKRYSDPSLFKIQRAPPGLATSEVGKEKKAQKPKKRGSHWRNGETAELPPASHAKLHQLFSMEHVDSGYRDPVFHVKMKRRQLNECPINSSSGRSYMEKFLQNPSTACEKVPGFHSKPRLPNVEGSAEMVDISCSQSSVNKDSLGTGTPELVSLSGLGAAKEICQLKETPLCSSSCENPQNLPQDPATIIQLHANEIGSTFSEASAIFEVPSEGRDTIDAPFEGHPVYLPQLPCETENEILPKFDNHPVYEAEGSKNEVLQTNYAGDCETENISNMETESVISFSVLMEEPFSCLASQQTEVHTGTSLFPTGTESVISEDISSEADAPISAAEINSELVVHVEVEVGKILPTIDSVTTSFEELSPVATLACNCVPEEDEVNLQNVSSMDTETDNQVLPFNTLMPDAPRNFQTQSESLSASSHNASLVDRDLEGMDHHHGQEDLQPVSIVLDDSKHGELLARDNVDTLEYRASISEDTYHNNQTGQDNIDSETIDERESTKSDVNMFCVHPDLVCSPTESLSVIQKSLLQHQKEAEQTNKLSSECCSRLQDQEQPNPSDVASTVLNHCDISVQDLFFDLEDSYTAEPESGSLKQGHLESERESLPQNNHLQGSENRLSSLTLNDCSEPAPSADHTDETPPPPPLPPIQWCMGKPQLAACSTLNESVETSDADLAAAPKDGWVPMVENALEAASTAGLSLPAVRHVAVDQSVQGTGFEGEAIEHVQQTSGEVLDPSPKAVLNSSSAGKTLPISVFGPSRTVVDENPHENPTTRKLSVPEASVVDAVPTIDRSMLRKVSERVQPLVEPKADEKDSLLELIRNKSFSLRPAVTSTRPNIKVAPQSNLKVVAILEKANTLRQAMAGSDDDDEDSDSWSDT